MPLGVSAFVLPLFGDDIAVVENLSFLWDVLLFYESTVDCNSELIDGYLETTLGSKTCLRLLYCIVKVNCGYEIAPPTFLLDTFF